ncbi:MAG TPA: hypothetical protein VFV24_10020, partial [Candidatus Eisenbacteria bacterium]|nr:hypothetical protein [Candidatus Eisenbacteria bacterium]
MRTSVSTRVLALTLAAALGVLVAGCAGTRRQEPPVATPTTAPPASTTPSTPTPDSSPPGDEAWRTAHVIRVGLVVYGPSSLVAGSTDWTLSLQGGPEVARRPAAVPLQIARVGEDAVEVLREGEDMPLWRGTASDTLLLVPSNQGYSGWGGKWYRGTFRIFASNPDGITIVNEVDFESYLRSVL